MTRTCKTKCPRWLRSLLTVVTLFVVAFSLASDLLANAKPDAKTQEPIPQDNVPKELRSLIDDGKVEVVYESDPEFVKAARGWADFNVQLRYTFKYVPSKSQKDGRWHVKLEIAKLKPTIELTHLIRLPVTFKSPDVWSGPILRHEFDHIAISLDPRAMLLLKHLLNHLKTIERTLEPKESPTNGLLTKLIDDEILKRREAVIELMRQNNIELDKIGAHGAQAVPDRAAFFAKLYTKENLAERKFPFIDEILDLLETPEYQQAELRFLPRDPAEPR